MQRAYYKISEVSKMLGVPYSKLRYWESVIPQLKPHQPKGKMRRYTPQDVELIKRIIFLREEQNLPIELIISTLKADSNKVDNTLNTIQILQKIKNELIELRNRV